MCTLYSTLTIYFCRLLISQKICFSSIVFQQAIITKINKDMSDTHECRERSQILLDWSRCWLLCRMESRSLDLEDVSCLSGPDKSGRQERVRHRRTCGQKWCPQANNSQSQSSQGRVQIRFFVHNNTSRVLPSSCDWSRSRWCSQHSFDRCRDRGRVLC